MKRIVKISICLAIIVMVILFGIKIERYLHRNYISREIFENIAYIYRYEDLIREKEGEYIENIVYTKEGNPVWLVYCNDIQVLYHYDTDGKKVLGFMYAQTSDSSYMFGEKGIQIGMDRDEVEKILKNSKKTKPNPHQELVVDGIAKTSYQDVLGYYDDIYDYGMGIIYDDHDKIRHISLYLGL